MQGPEKIQTRNLITKKNSCGSKIPLPPPITFLMVRPLLLLLFIIIIIIIIIIVVIFFCNSSNQQLWKRPLRASSPFLSRASSTFLLSPQKRKHWCLLRKLWLATIRDLLWNVYARVKARKEPGGDRPGAGEVKVRSCYTRSSIMSSKMRKSTHLRKF